MRERRRRIVRGGPVFDLCREFAGSFFFGEEGIRADLVNRGSLISSC